jgi:L-ribulose-5-phosphate 3-epimerase
MRIGYVDRSFPDSWRPALEEVAFAHANGFQALQYMVHPVVLTRPQQSDVPFERLHDALAEAGVMPTLEINCRVTETGKGADGRTPLQLLESYLPFITTMACGHVHLHVTAATPFDAPTLARVEEGLIRQLAEAVAVAATHNFPFAFEHNAHGEKNGLIFANPARCADALAAVPGLGFVWDFNHTHPDDLAGFLALASRVTLVHVSDTPLPAVNHHLPLGQGTVDLARYCGALRNAEFTGAMILEVGGLPISGGFGKDRDQALLSSRHLLQTAWNGSDN